MAPFPRQPIVRLVAIAWLLASVVLAAVTLLRPEMLANDRSALSTLVPLYFLSLSLGHLGVMAVSTLKPNLYLEFKFMPDIFFEGLALAAVLTALGYVQWFVLLPWIARGCSQLPRFLFKRDRAG